LRAGNVCGGDEPPPCWYENLAEQLLQKPGRLAASVAQLPLVYVPGNGTFRWGADDAPQRGTIYPRLIYPRLRSSEEGADGGVVSQDAA
jgi:hypothetical protein